MPKSTKSGKPAKPFPGYPLFAHATRRWWKKIKGKLVYFGGWDDPDAAPVHMRAMILLGANCGFGPHDCGRLPLTAVELETGWCDFARPKTGILRRVPLWPETVEAIRESLQHRPEPRTDAVKPLLFVTVKGRA